MMQFNIDKGYNLAAHELKVLCRYGLIVSPCGSWFTCSSHCAKKLMHQYAVKAHFSSFGWHHNHDWVSEAEELAKEEELQQPDERATKIVEDFYSVGFKMIKQDGWRLGQALGRSQAGALVFTGIDFNQETCPELFMSAANAADTLKAMITTQVRLRIPRRPDADRFVRTAVLQPQGEIPEWLQRARASGWTADGGGPWSCAAYDADAPDDIPRDADDRWITGDAYVLWKRCGWGPEWNPRALKVLRRSTNNAATSTAGVPQDDVVCMQCIFTRLKIHSN
jgi:hypothetical protein